MFRNLISIKKNEKDSTVYRNMIFDLENEFSFLKSSKIGDFTSQKDFIKIYKLTKSFYKIEFSEIYRNYVPLYNSLWKLRLKDVLGIDNVHQDGGVHYFSRNGYDSRMITIWTNIYKDKIPGTAKSDLGIFVIDNEDPQNFEIYRKMEKANAHFISKREGQLIDNMHVGGETIECDTDKIARRYFDYSEGDSILFNSHLLHGSKKANGDFERFSAQDLKKFRVSLTSVWIHKEDLDQSVLSMIEAEHEDLYMRKVEKSLRADVRRFFGEACESENQRLINIKKLIKEHIINGKQLGE